MIKFGKFDGSSNVSNKFVAKEEIYMWMPHTKVDGLHVRWLTCLNRIKKDSVIYSSG